MRDSQGAMLSSQLYREAGLAALLKSNAADRSSFAAASHKYVLGLEYAFAVCALQCNRLLALTSIAAALTTTKLSGMSCWNCPAGTGAL